MSCIHVLQMPPATRMTCRQNAGMNKTITDKQVKMLTKAAGDQKQCPLALRRGCLILTTKDKKNFDQLLWPCYFHIQTLLNPKLSHPSVQFLTTTQWRVKCTQSHSLAAWVKLCTTWQWAWALVASLKLSQGSPTALGSTDELRPGSWSQNNFTPWAISWNGKLPIMNSTRKKGQKSICEFE